MSVIQATWKNGQIIPDEPVDLPEGTKLVIRPQTSAGENAANLDGTTGDEQSNDPESIARWIAEFDAIPPATMTPEEEASWETWRKKMKDYNIEAVRRQMEEGIP